MWGWAKLAEGMKTYKLPAVRLSHVDEKYGIVNIVNNIAITLYGDHTFCGEHLRNVQNCQTAVLYA